MFTVLDLFSGAGGMHLAMVASDYPFKTVAFSEIEPFPSAVLAHRWPTIPNLGDITKVNDFPIADIICGGFPCQDISIANKNAVGISGSRSGLWTEMLRAIRQTEPKIVLIENSDQLAKRGLCVVLQDLASIGYDAEWHTITASKVGAPHKRARLIIIAYPNCKRRERLVKTRSIVKIRQWDWSGKADLQLLGSYPFQPSSYWPQPLIRRVDDGVANRTHRLRAVGNGVVVPLFTQIWNQIGEFLSNEE